ATLQRDVEVELRLARREATLHRLQPPPQLVELGHDPGPDLGALQRWHVTQAAYGVVGDAGLDLCGRPAPGDHRGTDPDGERTLGLEVTGHRRQPGSQ